MLVELLPAWTYAVEILAINLCVYAFVLLYFLEVELADGHGCDVLLFFYVLLIYLVKSVYVLFAPFVFLVGLFYLVYGIHFRSIGRREWRWWWWEEEEKFTMGEDWT